MLTSDCTDLLIFPHLILISKNNELQVGEKDRIVWISYTLDVKYLFLISGQKLLFQNV